MQHFYTAMFSPIAQSIKHCNVNHFNAPNSNSQFDELIGKGRKLFTKPSNPFKKRSKVQHNRNQLNDQNKKLLTDEYGIIMEEPDASFTTRVKPFTTSAHKPNTNYSYLHRNHTPYLKTKNQSSLTFLGTDTKKTAPQKKIVPSHKGPFH